MKKIFFLLSFLFLSLHPFAQKKWFSLYQDSVRLMKDATKITTDFEKDINKLSPELHYSIKAVLNTSPYLIYFDKDMTANLPLWEQVIPQQKGFFYEVAGGEAEGRKAFGLFFNGFYLPHELGHAFQYIANDSTIALSYQNEYFANTVAILWWRKHKRFKELKLCYEYAKRMWEKLPNPVAGNMSEEEYFTKNYETASRNPYTYGYMQFKQYIQIYEDKNLPDFDSFIKKYLSK